MIRSAAQIRQEFLDFFRNKQHVIVPSSPVVPHDDPTLLFTNAGMNQFKAFFLGTETPKHRRLADTQKCIRAGGKHNDLDDVGHDTYHHTFFEMLGNWSVGDYFKKEAIAWAWELLVDVWGLDAERLHATYFEGYAAEGLEPDIEARDLWLRILPPERVHPGNKKDNFWEMGATGPCGPCSEIHIDLTRDKSGRRLVNAGDARVIEIWNLVFIQFNRSPDGKLSPLPARHVDTGMGLERVTAVLQGHNNNYATDVFVPIIQKIEEISGHRYGDQGSGPALSNAEGIRDQLPAGAAPSQPRASATGYNRYAVFTPGDMRDEACRVLADHVRCLTFAVTDEAVPDREGRGYVLRRILRRAKRFARQYLGISDPILPRLASAVSDVMGETFPEVPRALPRVQKILLEEELAFDRTLDRGIALFNQAAMRAAYRALKPMRSVVGPLPEPGTSGPRGEVGEEAFSGDPNQLFDLVDWEQNGKDHRFSVETLTGDSIREHFAQTPLISGIDAFKLHDTYGFPIDLTQVMAQEKGLQVDIGEYERLMDEAREQARAGADSAEAWPLGAVPPDRFEMHGKPTEDRFKYEGGELGATVSALFRVLPPPAPGIELFSGQGSLCEGERGGVIVDKTCFYAEAGGQVGDQGTIEGQRARFLVDDTRRVGATVLHLGTLVQGDLSNGDEVQLRVGPHRRATRKNHTATHVMNWALREVLGDHVQQKGSLVDPEKTRFDFSNPKPLTPEQIERVEQFVNDRIQQKLTVHDQPVPQEQALKIKGLRAVFGEKYPDIVRVLSVGTPVADLVANPDSPAWRDVSIEFCGGTHVKNTRDIECFALIGEEAVAKGIRRVVAITGAAAKQAQAAGEALVEKVQALLAAPPTDAAGAVGELQQELAASTIPLTHRHRVLTLIARLQGVAKKQQKAAAADAAGIVKDKVTELLKAAAKIGETTVVVAEMPDVPVEQLKTGADLIKQKCGSAAVLFGVRAGEKAVLLAALTNDLIKKGLKAGDLVKEAAKLIKGGGGGPPTMAQAGGKDPEKLDDALDAGRVWIVDKLK